MSADAKNDRDLRLTVVRSAARAQAPAEFVRLSQLRKLRECEQVAAVCYRLRRDGIEFLLVRTRGSGRWTFPKGSAEPGLTHAQAAALEAFEEAGVHGRIEEASFARYVRRERGAVNAHLCQVLRLGNPKESKRDRTWFSVADARRRLREGRATSDGAQFARVVDKAVMCIQRMRGREGVIDDRLLGERLRPRWNAAEEDALRKVKFDFAEAYGWGGGASLMAHSRRQVGDTRQSAGPTVDPRRQVLQCEVLEFEPPRGFNRSPRWFPAGKKTKALGTGSSNG